MDSISDGASKQKQVPSFLEGENSSVSLKINRLFGREKPVHRILRGGTSADVMLWRNKKISGSVLGSATVLWLLFEWLNYHFLTLICVGLVLGMVVQFLWTNAAEMWSSSPAKIPRFSIPEEVLVKIAKSIAAEVNRSLGFLQDISSSGSVKHFLIVIASLWAAAVIGSWCNFITVIYIGFVAAHTLPVLYERYDDKIDSFMDDMFDQLRNRFRKLDTGGVLNKIPSRNVTEKKDE